MAAFISNAMVPEQFICPGNLGLSPNCWYSQTRCPPKEKWTGFGVQVKEEPLEFSVEKAALNVFYYQFLGGNIQSSQICLSVLYKTVKIHRQEVSLLASPAGEKSYKTQDIEDCFQEVRTVKCDSLLSAKVHECIRKEVLPFIQQWLKKDPVKTEPLAYV